MGNKKINKVTRKPCSVLDNHLSGPEIALRLKRFFLGLANDLYSPELNLASDMGLPSQDLPILLVMLLPHRCTIACKHLIPLPLGYKANQFLSF